MWKLVYRAAALRDLSDIADYITGESGRDEAENFIEKVTSHLETIASRSSIIGRSRVDLRVGYRSIVYGSYVIFIRYDDSQQKLLYVGNIIRGSRDLDAYFSDFTDEP
jgi:plasmid stabilization system protein ParE